MLTINLIREKKDFVIERLKVKNFDAREIVGKILSVDSMRRETQTRSDMLQAEMNKISKEIGQMMKEGKKDLAEMEALKQAGLAQVKLDKITNGIIDVITGSAIKTFL